MSGEERNFVTRVTPEPGGGFEVWIREEPYRGVSTDSALGKWERQQRVGGTWTSERLVGSRRLRRLAERLARKALRMAQAKAKADAARTARHRVHMEQPDTEFSSLEEAGS